MRFNQFSLIFRDAQRLSVQDAVQPCGGCWVQQIEFVQEQQTAKAHGKSQRAVLKDHIAVPHGEVPDQILKLQNDYAR